MKYSRGKKSQFLTCNQKLPGTERSRRMIFPSEENNQSTEAKSELIEILKLAKKDFTAC